MQLIPLFGVPIFKSTINPELYNKQEIMSTIEENYQKNTIRNKYDQSNLHQTYKDNDNPDFKKVDYSSLTSIYNTKIKEFISQMSWASELKYTWVPNISVYGEEQYLAPHSHIGGYNANIIFVCVHYASFPNDASPITFSNPSVNLIYNTDRIIKKMSKLVNSSDTDNSAYYATWDFDIKEDDFIMFHSYLIHGVRPNGKLSKLRVAIAINISLDWE